MTPAKHILGTFDEALSSLRNNMLMMAGLAQPAEMTGESLLG